MKRDELIEEREFAFEVDNQSMLRKVRKHLLADPLDYVRELVQMSVEAKATEINATYKPWKFVLEDNGEGITRNEIEHLLSRLFVPASAHLRYEGLAPAVISALETGAEKVVIESNAQGVAIRFTIDKELNMLFEESRRKKPGTRISVQRSFSGNLGPSKKRRRNNEGVKIKKYCAFVPADLRLNGKLLNPDKSLEDVMAQIEFQEGDDTRVMMGFPKEQAAVFFLKNGIVYDEVAYNQSYNRYIFDNLRIPLTMAIDSSRFEINLSRNGIVRENDEWINQMVREHLREPSMVLCERIPELRKSVDSGYSYKPPKMGSDLYLARQYLKQLIDMSTWFNRETKRFNIRRERSGFSKEDVARLRDVPLFTSLQRKPMSLNDLEQIIQKKGELSYTVYGKSWISPFRRGDECLEDLVILDNNSDFGFLKNLFGYQGLVSYRQILEREKDQKKWEQRYQKNERNPERAAFERELRYSSWPQAFRSLGEGLKEYLLHPLSNYVYSPVAKGTKTVASGIGKAGLVAGGFLLAAGGVALGVAAIPLVLGAKGIVSAYTSLEGSVDNFVSQRSNRRWEALYQKDLRLRKLEVKHVLEFYEKITRFLLSQEVLEMLPLFDLQKLPLPVITSSNSYYEDGIPQKGCINLGGVYEHENAIMETQRNIESHFTPTAKLSVLSQMCEDVEEYVKLTRRETEDKKKKRMMKKAFNSLKKKAGTLEERMKTGTKKKKKEEAKRTGLNFIKSYGFIRELLTQEDSPKFPYAFLPVFTLQLMQNNYKVKKYLEKTRMEISRDVLMNAQLKQIDRLSGEVIEDLLTQYESGEVNGFQHNYKGLGEDIRRKVIAGIYERDTSNPTLDEYLSKLDHELVDEVGTKHIREGLPLEERK